MAGPLHRLSLVPLCVLLHTGCASWVWDERYIECSDLESVTTEAWRKSFTFRIGPYPEPDAEDEKCEAVLRGLFTSRVAVHDDGKQLETRNVTFQHLRHLDTSLDLESLRLHWNNCYDLYRGDDTDTPDDDVERLTEDTGDTVLPLELSLPECPRDDDYPEIPPDPGELSGRVEIDHLDGGSHALRNLQMVSDKMGILEATPHSTSLACFDCSVVANIEQRAPVRVRIDHPREVVSLCFEDVTVADITLAGTPAPGTTVRLEFATVPSEVTVHAGLSQDLAIEIAVPASTTLTVHEGTALPAATEPPWIHLLNNPQNATFSQTISDGLCDARDLEWTTD